MGTVTFSTKGQTHRVGIHSRYAVCSRYTVGMQYAVGTFSAKRSNPHSGVCSRYAVHSTQYTVGMQYTVGTLSAKRSNPCSGVCSRYAVHSRCKCKKVNSHSGFSKYGWWGPLPLVQKGQTHTVGYTVVMQYAVGMQYTVGVSAKRSTHTVDLANMGGWDHYL